jgi:alpha-galactosidase
MYDRIRQRFPKLVMENCASGGGRNDLGMAKRFHHSISSDWQKLPRAVRILNGMTLAMPPERLAYFPGVIDGAHTRSDLDAQMRRSILGVPMVSGLCPERRFYNPQQIESARHHIEIFKAFIRPFLSACRVHHHTPVLLGREPHGWCALECVAEDYTRAVVSVFRLAGSTDATYRLHARGLDLGRRYKVTFDNERMVVEKGGEELRREGLSITVGHALGSQLLLFQAV